MQQVASGNEDWNSCTQSGDEVSCHRFTRAVASTLTARDSNWGLLTKNPGEQQCTLTQCGALGGEGYGEDVVAYKLGSEVYIYDIVGGAGAPGATLTWNGPLTRRAGNNWAPVP
mgnify:CR=1 FL=1